VVVLLQVRVHVAIAQEQHGEDVDGYRGGDYRSVIAPHRAADRAIAAALLDQRNLLTSKPPRSMS
jgi:hypothetical protein